MSKITPLQTTATNYRLISAATTNTNLIKTGTRSIQGIHAYNSGGSAAFIKLYNVATAPVIVSVAQVETVTLTGTSGTATITLAGGLTKTVTFDTDLATTAANFDTDFSADYTAQGITITSSGDDIIFTAAVAGTAFTAPVITNATGDLDGSVAHTTANATATAGPSITLPIAASGGQISSNLPAGILFENGLGIAITGAIGDTNTTTVGANAITVNIQYV